MDVEQRAREFHEAYERLAPQFGYETRPETREFDPYSPNGRLMMAVIAALTPPEGFVLVPLQPTEAMIAAAEEAHMPFGDMGFAISAALSARPEVKP
ncbi:hypothetical protein [Stenotrophomonas sp. ATs4]|uniref:hypothetical protein n=1 Tax=Stenotrophomonas sp. ATs4 TaxID=3402766 RepID=UPI003F7106AB